MMKGKAHRKQGLYEKIAASFKDNGHLWHSLEKWPKMHFWAKMSYNQFHVPC